MTERNISRPGVEFQGDLRKFLDDPKQDQVFPWRSENVYGEPIDMDLIVEGVDKERERLALAVTIKLNGRSSSFYLSSSRELELNTPYIGDNNHLITWLDTIVKELSLGMHQHVIVDCISGVLSAGRTWNPRNLYEQLLEELSRNRSRSLIEDDAKKEQIYKFDKAQIAILLFMMGTIEEVAKSIEDMSEMNSQAFNELLQRYESDISLEEVARNEKETQRTLKNILVAFLEKPDEVIGDNTTKRESLTLLGVLRELPREQVERIIFYL